MSYYHSLIQTSPAYGTLTTAWIVATGESDLVIISALNDFETEIASIKTLLTSVYPFVGGTAGKHALNFMNTTTHSLTFYGGITHNSNGITGNGTTGYATTDFTGTALSNNHHISIYTRNSVPSDALYFDYSLGNGVQRTEAFTFFPNYNVIDGQTEVLIGSNATKGSLILSRPDSNSFDYDLNGSIVNTVSNLSVYPVSNLAFLCRYTLNSPSYYSPRNLSFASVGTYLNATNQEILRVATVNFQTTLSRNV